MRLHVCRRGRHESILINNKLAGTDLFRQMRQQDVGVAAEMTITSAVDLWPLVKADGQQLLVNTINMLKPDSLDRSAHFNWTLTMEYLKAV